MKTLPFGLLNSSEFYAIANRIVDACKQTISDNEFLIKLYAIINEANNDLRIGLGRSFNSEFTSVLLLTDEKRDKAFIGFRDYIRAYCNHGDAIKEEAATNLSVILESVGNNLHRMPYAVESTKLDVLFENLSTPKAKEALETIMAQEWLERLKTRQEEFEKTYHSKIDTEAGIDLPLLKNSKRTLITYIKGLLYYVETNKNMEHAQFVAIEEKINVIITDAVTIARNRETRKEKADKKSKNASE